MTEHMENIYDVLADKNRIEQSYEYVWVIPNWMRVQKTEKRITSKKVEFKIGKFAEVQSKWRVGFKMHFPPSAYTFYWQLIECEGFPPGKVQATTECTIVVDNSTIWRTGVQKLTMSLGQVAVTPFGVLLNSYSWRDRISSDGKISFTLKLGITEPDFYIKQFHELSVANVHPDYVSLFGDETTADLKIITSDENELLAHKNVLQAQCPGLGAMFPSVLSENKVDILILKDVTSKTMGILLHLFYTGELLPSWKDQDTVVEFTNAASNYKLANVLKLLDNRLGTRDTEDASHADVQLLRLAQKFKLSIAEKELMSRIQKKISTINWPAEFFDLTRFDRD